jgi:hypothetical protein
MLFEIRVNTSRSAIFEDLNEEIGCFLKSCISAKKFHKGLFSLKLRDVIYANAETKKKFLKLWHVIKPLSFLDREEVFKQFYDAQFVQRYYEDKNHAIPMIRIEVKASLEELTKHLFKQTSALVGVKRASQETLHQHFDKFKNANKNICCFCGASELTQVLDGVDVEKQWKAANDHLLAKKEYPVFAVHPDNLIPLCEVCNSKAKLAKDLLYKKQKDTPKVRRLCFYPFVENCNKFVGIEVTSEPKGLKARYITDSPNDEVNEKINTWNDVYRMEERVNGKFSELTVVVENDCYANDLAELRSKIRDKAASCKSNCRLESWNFWKYRLYERLSIDTTNLIDLLWESILEKRNDGDAAEVYGI